MCSDFSLSFLPQAAVPAAPWAVPSVPRAASAKGRRASAAAVPDMGESLLPMWKEQHVEACIVIKFLVHHQSVSYITVCMT